MGGWQSPLNSTKLWPPSLSTLSAIVIPGLFQLSYGRNVPLHEKRSSLLMACLGSSPVFSQACQDMKMLSHTQPSHSSMNNVDIYYAGSLTLLYPNYLEEVSMLLWSSTYSCKPDFEINLCSSLLLSLNNNLFHFKPAIDFCGLFELFNLTFNYFLMFGSLTHAVFYRYGSSEMQLKLSLMFYPSTTTTPTCILTRKWPGDFLCLSSVCNLCFRFISY